MQCHCEEGALCDEAIPCDDEGIASQSALAMTCATNVIARRVLFPTTCTTQWQAIPCDDEEIASRSALAMTCATNVIARRVLFPTTCTTQWQAIPLLAGRLLREERSQRHAPRMSLRGGCSSRRSNPRASWEIASRSALAMTSSWGACLRSHLCLRAPWTGRLGRAGAP